jgi:hypothetical protein
MAQHIDRKLRLTAAFLGAVTRKDLAAAFRRVNSATAFDIDRANKWLQGRAQPRQLSVYEDWAKLLGLDRPGAWIADCNVEAFADTLCQRHGLARDELDRRAEALKRASSSSAREQRALEISGTYACYSNAWSPYYRGQLIRGVCKIEAKGGGLPGAVATYEELLPTGRLLMEGPIAIAKRGMYLSLQEPGGDNQFLYCFFPPSPPVSVLGGHMTGATIIGPEPQPSVTRIVLIRLPTITEQLKVWGGYLPLTCSIADDLAALDLKLDDGKAADTHIKQFLTGTGCKGIDQISTADFRALLEIFDRRWLGQRTSADQDQSTVNPLPRTQASAVSSRPRS